MAAHAVERRTVDVDGVPLSYLTAGDEAAPPLILLHGTFWSRVWQPVLPALAAQSRCHALDFPGFGRSGGELDVEPATVPALAQQLAATSRRIRKMVLMNAVMFDSWPVPAVERFKDPEVRRNTTEADLLAARRKSTQACALRTLSEDELEDYLSPWQSPARARSWMAMAAAADARYTLDLVPALKEAAVPTRLVWGRDDDFQKIEFARRYVKEIPNVDLVEVDGKHIPTEDSPDAVADAMLGHLANGR